MRIFSYFISIATYIFFVGSPASAQLEVPFDSEARSAIHVATTALVSLSSDDGISSGNFTFKNSDRDGADTKLKLTKLVGEFALGDETDPFRPLIEISPTRFKLSQSSELESDLISLNVSSSGLGTGIGLAMGFLNQSLEIIPRIKVEYSQIAYDVDVDSASANEEFTFGLADVKAWSYIPSIEGMYRLKTLDVGSKFTFGSKVSYIYVDSSTSIAGLKGFSSSSWLWKHSIAYEHAISTTDRIGAINIRPHIGRIDVLGEAKEGLGFNYFIEYGLDLTSTNIAKAYCKEVGFGVTYTYAERIQGWRFGVIALL